LSSSPQGLPASLKGLLATLLSILQTRAALFAVEVEEEKRRLLKAMAWGAVAVMLGVMGLGFVAVLVCVHHWDTQREWALAAMALVFALGAWAALALARAQVRASSPWMQASLDELEADRCALVASAKVSASARAAAESHTPSAP
jgi:uncharacterized membrane protein YqjE